MGSQYATGDGKGLKIYPNQPTNVPAVSGDPFVLTQYKQTQIGQFRANRTSTGRNRIDGFGHQYFDNADAIDSLSIESLTSVHRI